MSIDRTLPNFPLVNQLGEPTMDAQADENARNNCVAASIAASLEYLTGKTFDGDELKDAVYGQGYLGPMSAAKFEAYCANQGVNLQPFSGSQAALVAKLHEQIAAGNPCLITMPSQWGTAPADPTNPSGSTHVGVACGDGAGYIRVMNPWGGFWQDQPDVWWQARLCYGQVWPLQKVSAQVSGVPAGWKDDGKLLTAPNGVQVDLGFRDYILNNPWDPNNWPLHAETGQTPIEYSNPSLGGGTHCVFRYIVLEWTAARGVFVAWVGQELLWLLANKATLEAQVAGLQAKLQALQSAPPPPPTAQQALDLITADLKAAGKI